MFNYFPHFLIGIIFLDLIDIENTTSEEQIEIGIRNCYFCKLCIFLLVSLTRVQCLLKLDRVPGILATECGKKSLLTMATDEGPVNHLYKVGLNPKQYFYFSSIKQLERAGPPFFIWRLIQVPKYQLEKNQRIDITNHQSSCPSRPQKPQKSQNYKIQKLEYRVIEIR